MPLPRIDISAADAVAAAARPFRQRVLHRQILAAHDHLWTPTRRPSRYSVGIAALYTALALDVALAERIKRTGDLPVRLLVGEAEAGLSRTVDLTLPDTLAHLRISTEDLLRTHPLPQTLGALFAERGIVALLYPAALAETARMYPRFRFSPERGPTTVRATPSAGVNLVIFTDNLAAGDRYPEIRRFRCEVQGIPDTPSLTS